MENQIQEAPSEISTKPKRTRRPNKRPRNNDEAQNGVQSNTQVGHEAVTTGSGKNAIWSIEDFPVAKVDGKLRFHDLNLPDRVIKSIAEMGFEYCSEIQAETLPMTLLGYDIIGQAQTGTGKTAAFLIAMISDFLDYPLEEKRPNNFARGLIIAPTRELAIQIADEAVKLTSNCHLNVVTLVGGLSYEKQKIALETENVDILVATPGRLLDFARSRKVQLGKVECLVLDEADRMLSMGFIPDVKSIIRMTPHKELRQTMLFSATFPKDIQALAQQWTYFPKEVSVVPKEATNQNIDQVIYTVEADQKWPVLKQLINENGGQRTIIFANRRDETRDLYERLRKANINCAILSGEVAQDKRVKTLNNFKEGIIQVLVATDVAGRGIHVDNVELVVNYSLPEDPEDYVHRIGRTGRGGETGKSVSFASEDDAFMIPEIERVVGESIRCEYMVDTSL
ncbi:MULTISPECIES: DEAD/DEAH box helicase [Marinomonas]|uniref:ATP-dependent RNA helicase RhlB n=1 Tax=Marinomonas arctica TaxID=383750 RepID=A0A7H1J146_9GAMM|nr:MULTISPECIES: DEAD/DEAH box helicase [Marinomonas]MCS7487090.1 ATP-dependent RNA helicase RhlB [Marinomonas sp. BSi20414]QNT04212.1 DEAD/DEAH box helicase [Marinomonas arctica]GGN34544.1 ATP-dependent RNA helicase RhlB [Marinomonas arctica]